MHFHGIPPQHGTLKVHRHRPTHPDPGHTPGWPRALSRRQFATTVAGAVVGATLGAGVWRPRLAQARQTPEPVPIPGGSPFFPDTFAQTFHVFGPGPAGMSIDPMDAG
jgi:hypothetical protein